MLRKLKYKLCKTNLEKLYLVFIRTLFEYASEVWDNMRVGYINKLEQFKLQAVGIARGYLYPHLKVIYEELGRETFFERREGEEKSKCFITFKKNNAPEYLTNLISPKIQKYDGLSSTQWERHMLRRDSLLQLLSEDLVPSFDSRILVVGAYEAGKTTLVSNLIGKAIPRERQSTDGIDVYFGKLLFDLKKQKLLKKTKGVHSFPKAIYRKIVSYLKSVKREDVIPGKTQPDVPNYDKIVELSVKIHEYEDAESTELNVDQEVIPIPVLDFAGQIIYNATHQTFITSHGIYIITFNGSKELDAPLSDRKDERKTTILENIRKWVSSILLYSHPDNKDYPKLMFVATHKDLVCQEDIQHRRPKLLNTLSACFTDGNIKSHLMLQKLFFVDALNENDPEIEELRECISRTITENPHWGQKVPKQFLILEMMFAALLEEGKKIITIEEAEKMNTKTGVQPLSTAEFGFFLTVQNICGKMAYIDYPKLRNYIVIDPTCLIDVLKSIVTSVPVIASLNHGRLTKSDLTNIWSSEKFSHFLEHEEYFRQLLVHYDILSEVRRYDRESGKKISVDCYLVPCMITTQNMTTFVAKHLTSDKCVGFVFEFSATDVPDAIPCRLISSIISIWNIKSYENVDLLFSGFVAVVLDRKHDLVVKTERNIVAVYIVHKERKELIIKDLASCVRECLEQNLARISEVYSLSFTSDNITKRYVPFDVKLKSGCLSPNCLLDAHNLNSIETNWVCDNHQYITPKCELNIWYTDRTTLQCTDACQGVLDAVLSMLLNDSQLLRICNSLTKEEVRSLAFNLGVSNTKLDAIDSDSISMIKFYSLRICREKNKACKDFVKAMEAAEVNRHTMCQILRQEEVATDFIPDKILNLPPSDEMLDKLCLRIGKEWMVLGLELGLEIERLEQIEYDNPKVLREVCRQMLYCWRNRENNSTIREVLHALERSGRNPHLITEILENCESYPKLIPVD